MFPCADKTVMRDINHILKFMPVDFIKRQDLVSYFICEITPIRHLFSYDQYYEEEIIFEQLSQFSQPFQCTREEFIELSKKVDKLNKARTIYDSKIKLVAFHGKHLTPYGISLELEEIEKEKELKKQESEAKKKKAAETRKQNALEKKKKQLEKLKKELEGK